MSNLFPAVIGVSLMAFTAALTLLCHRCHVRGYTAGAGRVTEDIRMFMLKQIGEGHPHAISALMQAVGIAHHHARNYMAEIEGEPRPLPRGEARHRKVVQTGR